MRCSCATRLVDQFPVVDKGLLFHGDNGVGKTHLAVALMKEAIRRKGARAVFFETRDLLKLVRDTYNNQVEATELDVLRPVLEAELLVLDDIGAEKKSRVGRGNARPGRQHALQRASRHGLHDEPERLREYRAELRRPPAGPAHPLAAQGDVRLGRDRRTGYARGRPASDARGHRALAGDVAGLAEESRPRKPAVRNRPGRPGPS